MPREGMTTPLVAWPRVDLAGLSDSASPVRFARQGGPDRRVGLMGLSARTVGTFSATSRMLAGVSERRAGVEAGRALASG